MNDKNSSTLQDRIVEKAKNNRILVAIGLISSIAASFVTFSGNIGTVAGFIDGLRKVLFPNVYELVQDGNKAIEEKGYKLAEEKCFKATKIAKESDNIIAEAWYCLGRSQFNLNKNLPAIESFKKATKAAPKNPDMWNELIGAQFDYHVNKPTDACESLNQAKANKVVFKSLTPQDQKKLKDWEDDCLKTK